ncbi:hypothetical protein HOU00_gp072 [Caulobacter phage CcrPW]|uniref:Uncharacterized protein n=1 Tax=Caulobacter phage CcrPW TaxID=2283271 RepID=A0A385E9Q6_9CAUD|nr:hypothetical protein HOU00_gp072 [Caulobacter phage CcrPW]AXQ68611.1 hypothetical protein CcrPW_gp072 [Caulobacter phage CcrPW]
MIQEPRPLLGMVLAATFLSLFAILTYPLRLMNVLPSETAWGARASDIFDEEGL